MVYLLELGYKGTAYSGWQVQKNGIAVQQVLDEALTTLFRTPIHTLGSSRTDAGVHARHQVAQFETEVASLPDSFLKSLNAILPDDIAVHAIYTGKEGINVRFDALARQYEYRILFSKNPFEKEYAWLLPLSHPRIELLNGYAAYLRGTHDFEAFSKHRKGQLHHRCTVLDAHWDETPTGLRFHIKANRFVRGMVRALVGTMVKLHHSAEDPSEMLRILQSKNRSFAASLAPSQGLFLDKVYYPDTYFTNPLYFGRKEQYKR